MDNINNTPRNEHDEFRPGHKIVFCNEYMDWQEGVFVRRASDGMTVVLDDLGREHLARDGAVQFRHY